MDDRMNALCAARDFLRARWPEAPSSALVLGSGYATIADAMTGAERISYTDIPGFPACTNPSHPGRLVVGELWGHRVAVLQGRLHGYEGYPVDRLVIPVRSLALWGIPTFLLTNAAGAINRDYEMGQFMALTDHINMMGMNPLSGPNLDGLGTRFPDLSHLYDVALIDAAQAAASRAGLALRRGVYAAMLGPSYETPAEIQMLRVMGADAVGMSTVPEAIALAHMGRRVFALSCLTNLAAGISEEALSDDDIVQVLDRPGVHDKLRAIISGVLDAAR